MASLGVLCALEVIRSLDDRGARTRHPVGMVIFTNEEGARFQPAMIGSGVMAGKIPLEDAYNTRDRDGVRLGDELERIGYLGPEPCIPRPLRAYLELHIEQGPFSRRKDCRWAWWRASSRSRGHGSPWPACRITPALPHAHTPRRPRGRRRGGAGHS
jgi:N-carbamoyl-L-amino-acid hydrolase